MHLELPAKAENVGLARNEVAAHAAELGLTVGEIADLKTVVSEACNNVVNYAYEEGLEGAFEVEVRSGDGSLTVFVRDRGCGICPQPEADVPSLKMGLPLIGALSDRFRLTSELGRGTELEVRMRAAGTG
jgi:stage II sporulation protein AB (anti-sigma F factor)